MSIHQITDAAAVKQFVHAGDARFTLVSKATGTRFTYRVALDPRLPVAAGGPLSHMYFDSMFKSACEHLQSYVREV